MSVTAIFKIIEKIMDLLFYFINKKEVKEREENREKLKEDSVAWFNDRYSSGVQPDEPTDTKTKRTDGE